MDILRRIAYKQLEKDNKISNSYALCFSQPLLDESLDKSLINAIGSRSFQIRNYIPYKTFEDKNLNRNNCYSVDFFLDPHQDYDLKVDNIQSEYGETMDFVLKLKSFDIPDKDNYIKLVGNPMTFLASRGDYGQKIQIVAKNQEDGKLYYRACNFLRDNPEAIIENMKKFKKKKDSYSNRFLASQFVEC